MSHELQKVRVRNALKTRREPYWASPIQKGQYIGLRKISDQRATWIARLRDEATGRQKYKALGDLTDQFEFDQAKVAAMGWFGNQDAGVTDDLVTVSDACRDYVIDRKRERGEATAHDAMKRFERTVYGTIFGALPLTKLRTPRIKEWRDGLGLSKAASNRTLTALKAALNLAILQRRAPIAVEREWRDVKPYKDAGKRRDLFLDLKQRRALLKATEGALRDLIEGAAVTGSRAGELVKATRRQFDARTQVMTFIGKTGARTVPLTPAALKLLKRLSAGKGPDDLLFLRPDGKPWAHSDWDQLVRAAAEKAKLPAGTCLYTLRHSFITTAISAGMTTLDVARLVGTSVMMIEKHYGHLVKDAARERLKGVKLV